MTSNKEPTWLEKAKTAFEEGASDVEICKILNITHDEFMKNYGDNSQFRRFIDMGRMLSKAWWYEQGRVNLKDKGFNTSLWSFNMKNKFGWAEKQENYDSSEVPEKNLSSDELRSKITKLTRDMLKTEGKTDAQILLLDKENGRAN